MRKILFLLLLTIVCIGCEDQKGNIAKCYALFSEAEQAEQTIETIPCGIKFGMTKDEINVHLEKLSINSDSTNVRKKDDFYYYTFNLPTGNYEALILPALPANNEIHNISFIFRNSIVSLPESKDDNLLNDLKQMFNGFITSSCVIGDKEHLHEKYTCWTKDNLAIYFNNDYFFCGLTFANAPIDKTAHTLKFTERITSSVNSKIREEESTKPKEIKVENSPWDASVYQVRKYLKKNLKDPKSYEGIEWSEAQKIDNGYMVRHKYRAKNSFGGYTIENQIFYLDSKGNVVNTVNAN